MVILCIVLSVFAAVIACSYYVSHGFRPPIWLAIVAAMLGSLVLLIWTIDWSQAFTYAYWADDKWGILNAGLPLCGLFMAVCLIPTSIVVFSFQWKWKNDITKP